MPAASEIIREIDATIDAIDALRKTCRERDAFYRDFLRLTAAPIQATTALVLLKGPAGEAQVRYVYGLEQKLVPRDDVPSEARRLLQREDTVADQVQFADETCLVVSAPICAQAQDTLGRLALYFRYRDIPEAAHRGFMRFAEAVSELAGEFETGLRWDTNASVQAELAAYTRLTRAIHGPWKTREVAFRIANEGRVYSDCDRVSVFAKHGATFRMIAVSGVDVIDRRSTSVRTAQHLATAVAEVGEAVVSDGSKLDLAPQIEGPLDDYYEIAAPKSVAVIPLTEPELDTAGEDERESRRGRQGKRKANCHSVLMVELVETQEFDNHRVRQLGEQAELALRKSVMLQDVPLLPLGLTLKRICDRNNLDRLKRIAIVSLVAFSAMALLLAMPAELTMDVRGELQPQERRHVFAPADGVVGALAVRDGDRVQAGQTLFTVESKELDLEFEQLSSELATTQQRLNAIDAMKLEGDTADFGRPSPELRSSELAGEELTLRQQVASLNKQLQIVRQRQRDLVVKSPMDGDIVSMHLQRHLLGRPVQTGQTLMAVARLDGPWIIEFKVPDTKIGHVLDAVRRNEHSVSTIPPKQTAGAEVSITNESVNATGHELAVDFVVANAPEHKYIGETRDIGLVTRSTGNHEAFVLVEATFPQDPHIPLRPGATVVGKIHCGRRTLWFVWFHEIKEELQRWLF